MAAVRRVLVRFRRAVCTSCHPRHQWTDWATRPDAVAETVSRTVLSASCLLHHRLAT